MPQVFEQSLFLFLCAELHLQDWRLVQEGEPRERRQTRNGSEISQGAGGLPGRERLLHLRGELWGRSGGVQEAL